MNTKCKKWMNVRGHVAHLKSQPSRLTAMKSTIEEVLKGAILLFSALSLWELAPRDASINFLKDENATWDYVTSMCFEESNRLKIGKNLGVSPRNQTEYLDCVVGRASRKWLLESSDRVRDNIRSVECDKLGHFERDRRLQGSNKPTANLIRQTGISSKKGSDHKQLWWLPQEEVSSAIERLNSCWMNPMSGRRQTVPNLVWTEYSTVELLNIQWTVLCSLEICNKSRKSSSNRQVATDGMLVTQVTRMSKWKQRPGNRSRHTLYIPASCTYVPATRWLTFAQLLHY